MRGVLLNRTFVIKNDNPHIWHLATKTLQNPERSPCLLSVSRTGGLPLVLCPLLDEFLRELVLEAWISSSGQWIRAMSLPCSEAWQLTSGLPSAHLLSRVPAPSSQSNQGYTDLSWRPVHSQSNLSGWKEILPKSRLGSMGPGTCSFLNLLPHQPSVLVDIYAYPHGLAHMAMTHRGWDVF